MVESAPAGVKIPPGVKMELMMTCHLLSGTSLIDVLYLWTWDTGAGSAIVASAPAETGDMTPEEGG
jgi:hypothetical protein